jgi:hypothetical protein
MGKLNLCKLFFLFVCFTGFHYLGSSWVFPSLLACCRGATFLVMLYEAY